MTNKLKIFYLIILVFLLLSFAVNIGYSQDKTNSYNYTPPPIEFNIQFVNKRVYFLGDPIKVKIQIINRGIKRYLFNVSDEKVFSFDFEVLSRENQPVEHSKEYYLKRNMWEAVFVNKVSLETDEIYGVIIDLNEWFNFEKSGEYYIRGIFYPNLITDSSIKIYSENELPLELRPAYPQKTREVVKKEITKRIKAQPLPPYQVVNLLIKSLIKNDFDTFFLYINFDKFIMQFSNARKEYIAAKDVDKPKVIKKFKDYLMGKNKLESLPFSESRPVSYKIKKTLIENNNAQVEVIETFKYAALIEKKLYRYYLHKYGDIWLLERYEVINKP